MYQFKTKLKNLRKLLLDENFLRSTLPEDMGRWKDLEILTVNVSRPCISFCLSSLLKRMQ